MEFRTSPFVDVDLHRQPRGTKNASDLAYVEDLARKLAAFGLLNPKHLPPSPPKKPVFYDPSPLVDGFVRRPAMVGRSDVVGNREGWSAVGLRPAYQPGFVKPVVSRSRLYPCDGSILLSGAQMQQRLRVVPPQSVLGPRRKCSGTGVFLPRIVDNNDDRKFSGMCSPWGGVGMKHMGDHAPQKRQQLTLQRQQAAMSRLAVTGQANSVNGQAEPNLPLEWTY